MPSSPEPGLASNLQSVRSRIDAAARHAGRDPAGVRLIAVSKTFGADAVRAVWAAGHRDFGENKVQEALQKIQETADMEIRWHLIGHLQSNKAKKAAGAFACIQSMDSIDLLQRVDAAAVEQGTSPEVLVQVDLAGEATKFGADVSGARRLLDRALDARAARVTGLMLIPPWNEDQEQTRPWFVRLRELRDRWLADGVPAAALRHLSMGMSHDFEAAIEEGATIVRVGTAIFGKRTVRT
ncbi:MAG: YggS family pyridoxal phosphate enzyme [Acidobacteria bacterium RIFCSPLOWO2_02_FULL_67_36]|nr:MAG: YggS family pyridoxal phosphate enzyme [Acidobacteria bacterium RIFCSPLOWO2_02_FULL_67_36]OFW23894.1 MAG: YggS family pyridoxal phosphate enzyme [Acidobacteria bacterium RIFCSPLOWO2_12_FULL_66_21]